MFRLHTVKWSNSKFQTIHFGVITQFNFIWPIDRNLSDATTLGYSKPENNGNEGVLHIPQSSSLTGTSPSDFLMSYPGHSFREFYPSAEKQSVYSTAPADWAIYRVNVKTVIFQIIQFSISTLFRCQNSSISSNSV